MSADFVPSDLIRGIYTLRAYPSDADGNTSIEDYVNVIPKKSITNLTDADREIFTVLFTVILIISAILNLKAILTVSRRNYRFFQKTCIISLALSDILTVISFSVNNLSTFSNPSTDWTLGDFLCHFLPMAQSIGVFSSSIALLLIAMDRYRTIVKAMNKRWDPRKLYCISGTFIIWIIGLSIPMYIYYKNMMILVIFLDENGKIPENYKIETLYMCVSVDKQPLRNSYTLMTIFVFAPLLIIFFWFYYSIAQLIWHHRRPVEVRTDSKTEISTTETTVTKSNENNKTELVRKNKNEQMKKKLRTFKVILVLITSFVVCRLPFWVFTIIKLSHVVKGLTLWRVNYLISALNVTSTILNPLLYTYLNITIRVVSKIIEKLNAFLCCIFFDDDFVEFKDTNVIHEDKNVRIIQVKQC